MENTKEYLIFENSINSVENVIQQINQDIKILQRRFAPNDIKISIPKFYQKLLEFYFRDQRCWSGHFDFREHFGCEVVIGYNSQICVFGEDANPNGPFCKPIVLVNKL